LEFDREADEVRHFRYAPVGWANIEIEQQQVRKLLINVLHGITPISVKPATQEQITPQPSGTLFPRPPSASGPTQ